MPERSWADHEETIRLAAMKAVSGHMALERAIVEAHPKMSLRAIASAAGISHEQVRRIISRTV